MYILLIFYNKIQVYFYKSFYRLNYDIIMILYLNVYFIKNSETLRAAFLVSSHTGKCEEALE
jgi:hypothetical protein